MKVRAKSEGFFGGGRKRVGAVFDIPSEKFFSARWMESLEDLKEEQAKPEAKAKGKNGKEAVAKSSGDVEVI